MNNPIAILMIWAVGAMLVGHAIFTNPDHDARFGFIFLGLSIAFMILGALLTMAKWKFFG